MKEKIIATNRHHLKLLVDEDIKKYGNECDLNHIDVSSINNMSNLFSYSDFNGDISKWDVSSVTDMDGLFYVSKFNNDISSWNTSKVINMNCLFYHSDFNGNIYNWNVSKVTDMFGLFAQSEFNGDLSNWRPLKVEKTKDMFLDCKAFVPYWFGSNNEEIVKKIESYDLFNKMDSELPGKDTQIKKMKI